MQSVTEPHKKWSLKSLAMLKCDSRIVRVVYMQYNVSDSQALFWCFVLIILKPSLDTSYVRWDSRPDFTLSLLSRLLFSQNCCYKKRAYKHSGKRTVFRVLQFYKIQSTNSLSREKTISFWTTKEIYLLDKLLHNRKQIKELFEF